VTECLANLSDGWIPVEYRKKAGTEVHYRTPELKIEFNSFKRAQEFDGLLKQHLNNEKVAIAKFMSEMGGYKKLRSYVCNLKEFPFLQETRFVNRAVRMGC
jgi:hypothetical protein